MAPVPAEQFINQPAVREVIAHDPRYSTRWHRHDEPHPLARWNFHPEYEVHLVIRGSGSFIVGDQVGTFGAGHLVLVGPELPHNWVSDPIPGEWIFGHHMVLQFTDQWMQSAIEVMPELADLRPMLRQSMRGIEFRGGTASRAAAALADVGTADGTARLISTLTLLGLLANAPQADQRVLANEWIAGDLGPSSVNVVNRTLDYIFTNIAADVRLSTAARIIGMSESAFSRYFRRASGHTFSDIVRRLRIAHACKLLDATEDSVATIAHAAGYRNLSNFNRQFLAETGLTPRGYRARTDAEPLTAS